ncbi:hypothetical protein CYMTET_23753 [Cymbomonas tetramitiformis]|uniref:Membrane protein UL124 n=1 Tax=Cymbomonas tetramitiformis TaxID=36881 RepID=A0AAE0FXB6_9CHLO|nr:hypothetical protein CYMTET_23753 [Cymbomonas tetramitiformis]
MVAFMVILMAILPATTSAATLDTTNNHAEQPDTQSLSGAPDHVALATMLVLATCAAAAMWILPKAHRHIPNSHVALRLTSYNTTTTPTTAPTPQDTQTPSPSYYAT